jgi:uncharacterized protein (DUF1330 family)
MAEITPAPQTVSVLDFVGTYRTGRKVVKTQYKVALAMLASAALGALAVQGLHAQAKPPGYIITEVEVIDQAAFNEFSPKASASLQAFGGKYLVRGGKVATLEGEAPKRVVVTVFDSMEKAQAYRTSPGWKALESLRTKAAKGRAYVVEGVSQ